MEEESRIPTRAGGGRHHRTYGAGGRPPPDASLATQKTTGASYRTAANPRSVGPEKVEQHRGQWRAANRPKIKAQKKEIREAYYFRPFVAIDSEGRNYPGENDIYHDEASGRVLYERHDTYLWGAAA